jgi:2-(1,2-epoxy-1,2-dihydrophenyl)acetyl-CoA isomerase
MADPHAWSGSLEHLTDTLRARARISELLHEMPKPTVAMIERAAAGAGLSLALACDFRIAGAQAKITTAFVKVALSGDFGGTYFLTKLVGSAKARELYLTSPVVSGEEALRLGLVTKVSPDQEVDAVARAFALELANAPTVTVGYIKKNINAAETRSLSELLDLESLHHSRCMGTEDHREAANAFLEKRPATFKAR